MTSSELDFEELLKKYDYKFQKGDLVKGIVCGYDSQGVMVDIGAKTIAVVPTREAVDKDENVEQKFKKGDEYEFLIIREEDEDGKFLLSKKKVDLAYAWKELEKAKEADETILGTVAGIVKGGVLVEVSGVRGFVPSSQLRVKESDLEVGSKLKSLHLIINKTILFFLIKKFMMILLLKLEKMCSLKLKPVKL